MTRGDVTAVSQTLVLSAEPVELQKDRTLEKTEQHAYLSTRRLTRLFELNHRGHAAATVTAAQPRFDGLGRAAATAARATAQPRFDRDVRAASTATTASDAVAA